jgi:transcriptional regulator with XRE-family HTH domain
MFKDIFVELLQKKQLTVYRIAKDTSISQGLMNEYKTGIKRPTIDNLMKIADYLDVSTDYLLGRTNNPEVNK